MIKKMLVITVAIALLLGQSTIAEATTIDTSTVTAEVDLSTAVVVPYLKVLVRRVSDNGEEAGGTPVAFDNAGLGDGYVIADHYLEVRYLDYELGWGVQIYSDNMNSMGVTPAPSPLYDEGDPDSNLLEQPNGLLGVGKTLLTCPLVILTSASIPDNNEDGIADLVAPVETPDGTKGTPGFVIYFENGFDANGDAVYDKVWYWLKDLKGTKWPVDTNGDGIADPGELIPSFNGPADDDVTIVNSFGVATGWADGVTKEMIRDPEVGSKLNDGTSDYYPTYVFLAADFRRAREKRLYKTETITLELYHD